MNNIDLDNIKEMGVYFKTVNIDNLYNKFSEEDFSEMYMISDEKMRKIFKEKREEIEYRMLNTVTNSKENIKSTVPIINSVNKQLIQNNLLLKMQIENMKQTYRNIVNYCSNLQLEMISTESNQFYELLNDIIDNFKSEIHNTRED